MMSRLMDELFHGSRLMALPVLALALFAFAFVVVVVRASRRSPDADAKLAALPLDDETLGDPASDGGPAS